MVSLKIKPRHRNDLLSAFPHYNYQNPVEPWRLDPTRQDNTIQLQVATFHYYWLTKACGETGLPGLSLITPNLPYCITVPKQPEDNGPIFNPIGTEDLLYFDEKNIAFGAIVLSAALHWFPCFHERPCDGAEIRVMLSRFYNLLLPNGILIGVLFDALMDKKRGSHVHEKTRARHAWSTGQFRQQIITPLEDIYSIVEYDTLRNGLTFNFVLQKRENGV